MSFKKGQSSGTGEVKGATEYNGIIQPIALDPMRELGKGLG